MPATPTKMAGVTDDRRTLGDLEASGDLPPTGHGVRLDYIQVLRFRDGTHVSFNLSFDRLAMLEQLGP